MNFTPQTIYADYTGRRRALIRALTADSDKLFAQSDPSRDNMCLFGYPDGSWSVDAPPEEVPAEVPEPSLGINFARDGMERKDWLALVAMHSDAWLMSLAFYKGARLDQEERDELFGFINRVPTIFEVVTGRAKQGGAGGHAKKLAAAATARVQVEGAAGGGGGEGAGMMQAEGPGAAAAAAGPVGEEELAEEGEGDPCPQCGRLYRADEFWIACDFCDTWYCGRCAKMTELKASKVKDWKCNGCN